MKCYIVDAFTKEIFKGNPAAVCVLDHWLPDELMQHIAMENSLSETAFTVKPLRPCDPGHGLCPLPFLRTRRQPLRLPDPQRRTNRHP